MSDNCDSSPTGGCNDSKTLEALVSLLEMTNTKLSSIVSKKTQINIDLEACNAANNAILEDIIAKYETVIADNCCEDISANLQTIIELLNGLVYSSSCRLEGNIECDIEVTTTETPTTTEHPTTTASLYFSGTFYVSNISLFPCIEDSGDQQTLHYEGVWGTGTQMFTDFVEGTPLAGYLYIKQYGNTGVYNIDYESGVVGTLAYTCE